MLRLVVLYQGQVEFRVEGQPELFASSSVRDAFWDALWAAAQRGPGLAIEITGPDFGAQLR